MESFTHQTIQKSTRMDNTARGRSQSVHPNEFTYCSRNSGYKTRTTRTRYTCTMVGMKGGRNLECFMETLPLKEELTLRQMKYL